MKWSSAIGYGQELKAALDSCIAQVLAELGPNASPDLIVVFPSIAYGRQALDVAPLLKAQFPNAAIFGCTAGGVIGGGVEAEDRPAVALTASHLPGVSLTPFRITRDSCPSPDAPPEAWEKLTGVTPKQKPSFMLLMDPFAPPAEHLTTGLDFAYPASAKVGGLASGGRQPGSHTLYLDGNTYHDGGIGLALTGNIVVDTVVAQGCRPIGEPRRITKCQDNVLLAVDGEPPIHYLRAVFPTLSTQDQELVTTNLFLGMAMDPLQDASEVKSGDFLIRNIIGADPERGIIAVGEYLREGQVVQFHVRDALTSSEDLQAQLTQYLKDDRQRAKGALLFQCNGRGRHLYGRPNHDSDMFKELAGPVPLGGFFCNGEIGQVRGATYLHGYTSAFALFLPRATS
jgi:small ligand-binding sensory domain FIST